MGKAFVDKYSLLHFAVGIVAYFWSFSLAFTLFAHVLFEIVENTPTGMRIINAYFTPWWPGGKSFADSFVNSMGDNVATVVGWLLAYLVDLYAV